MKNIEMLKALQVQYQYLLDKEKEILKKFPFPKEEHKNPRVEWNRLLKWSKLTDDEGLYEIKKKKQSLKLKINQLRQKLWYWQ